MRDKNISSIKQRKQTAHIAIAWFSALPLIDLHPALKSPGQLS